MVRFSYFPFLFLLFIGTVCNSMAVSFMGFYLIEGLGQAPWSISLYTGCFAIVVIVTNKLFSSRMDDGANPFSMIGVAASSFLTAAIAISLAQELLFIVVFGAVGFGIGASAMSTKFRSAALWRIGVK